MSSYKKSTELDQNTFEDLVVEGIKTNLKDSVSIISFPNNSVDKAGKYHIKQNRNRIGEIDKIILINKDLTLKELFTTNEKRLFPFITYDENICIPKDTYVIIEATVSNGNTITTIRSKSKMSYLDKKLKFHQTLQDIKNNLTDDNGNVFSLFKRTNNNVMMLLVYNGSDSVSVNTEIIKYRKLNPNIKCASIWVEKKGLTQWIPIMELENAKKRAFKCK